MVQELKTQIFQCENCLSTKNHTFTDEWNGSILNNEIQTKREWRICENCGHRKMISEMTRTNSNQSYQWSIIKPNPSIIKF